MSAETVNVEPQLTVPMLIIFVPMIVFTLVSNSFVIYAISNHPPLKTPSNQLLLSLATTDLLSASIVMPVACYYGIVGVWYFEKIGCQIWLFTSVSLSSSSILHLCAISIDRYKAISAPVTYATARSNQKSLVISCMVWISSFLSMSPPYLFSWGKPWPEVYLEDTVCVEPLNRPYAIYLALVLFFIPMTIILVTYAMLYSATRKIYKKKIKQAAKVLDIEQQTKKWTGNETEQTKEAIPNENATVPQRKAQPRGESLAGRDMNQCASNVEEGDGALVEKESKHAEEEEEVGFIADSECEERDGAVIQTLPGLVTEVEIADEPYCHKNIVDTEVQVSNDSIEVEAGHSSNVNDSQASEDKAGSHEDVHTKHMHTVMVEGSRRRQIRTNFNTIMNLYDSSFPAKRCQQCQVGIPRTNESNLCQICSAPNALWMAAQQSRVEILIQKERRSMFVIAIIVGTFAVCWGPGFIYLVTVAVHPTITFGPWINGIWLLAYANSACNPVIYTIFNPDFREAFTKYYRKVSTKLTGCLNANGSTL